jgi:hypothetical protein
VPSSNDPLMLRDFAMLPVPKATRGSKPENLLADASHNGPAGTYVVALTSPNLVSTPRTMNSLAVATSVTRPQQRVTSEPSFAHGFVASEAA